MCKPFKGIIPEILTVNKNALTSVTTVFLFVKAMSLVD